jgi:hypothetical protein
MLVFKPATELVLELGAVFCKFTPDGVTLEVGVALVEVDFLVAKSQ